jgi:hypothetical protein
VYEAHNDAVRAHFASRANDLLVMNLASGDGWEKLAPFLGVATPDIPFPAKNRSNDRTKLSFRVKRKVMRTLGLVPSPEQIT